MSAAMRALCIGVPVFLGGAVAFKIDSLVFLTYVFILAFVGPSLSKWVKS